MLGGANRNYYGVLAENKNPKLVVGGVKAISPEPKTRKSEL